MTLLERIKQIEAALQTIITLECTVANERRADLDATWMREVAREALEMDSVSPTLLEE